jgi:hypothetical protein
MMTSDTAKGAVRFNSCIDVPSAPVRRCAYWYLRHQFLTPWLFAALTRKSLGDDQAKLSQRPSG